MIINENTRIVDLIRFRKESIDAIASLSKPLRKLRNPVLRKLLAPRVRISEAANLGACSIQDFVAVLEPLGFEFQPVGIQPSLDRMEEPAWFKGLSEHRVQYVDARVLLALGQDPLNQIMDQVKHLEPAHVLCIVSDFKPSPLIHILEKKGFFSFIQEIEPGLFHAYFYSGTQQEVPSDKAPVFVDSVQFEQLVKRFESARIRELDVRGLSMPLPMETILSALHTLQPADALFVHHQRVPLYLLEELAGQTYQVYILQAEEDGVKLLIFST